MSTVIFNKASAKSFSVLSINLGIHSVKSSKCKKNFVDGQIVKKLSAVNVE